MGFAMVVVCIAALNGALDVFDRYPWTGLLEISKDEAATRLSFVQEHDDVGTVILGPSTAKSLDPAAFADGNGAHLNISLSHASIRDYFLVAKWLVRTGRDPDHFVVVLDPLHGSGVKPVSALDRSWARHWVLGAGVDSP